MKLQEDVGWEKIENIKKEKQRAALDVGNGIGICSGPSKFYTLFMVSFDAVKSKQSNWVPFTFQSRRHFVYRRFLIPTTKLSSTRK